MMTASHDLPRRTYRFTVSELLRMVEAGLLADRRVELLDGELVCMTAKGPLHVYIAATLHDRFTRALSGDMHARKEDPLVTSATSAPEPDVAIVRGARRDWRDRLPAGSDCLLAVEVSVTTLDTDRSKLQCRSDSGSSDRRT